MVKFLKPLLAAALLCGGMLLSSCSSGPSEEELSKLAELKKQVRERPALDAVFSAGSGDEILG